MSQYIGLHLEIALTDASVVSGTVAALDEQTTYMTLSSVTIRGANGTVNEVPKFVIHGSQIRNLEVIQKPPLLQQQQPTSSSPSVAQTSKQAAPQNTPPPPAAAPVQKQQTKQFVDPAIISMSMPSNPVAPSITKKQEKKQQQQQQQQPLEFDKPNEVTTPSAPPKPVAAKPKSAAKSEPKHSPGAASAAAAAAAAAAAERSTMGTVANAAVKSPTPSSSISKQQRQLKAAASPKKEQSTPTSPTTAVNGKSSTSTTPKTSSRLPLFANTGSKAPRKPITETEILDFEDLFGSPGSSNKSSKHKKKAADKQEKQQDKQASSSNTPTKPQDTNKTATATTTTINTATATAKEQQRQSQGSPIAKAESEKMKTSKSNDVVNQEASALLASMLHLPGDPPKQQQHHEKPTTTGIATSSANEEGKEQTTFTSTKKSPPPQSGFKIPANLIPPKARSSAKTNGTSKVSPKDKSNSPTTAATSATVKEKVNSPKSGNSSSSSSNSSNGFSPRQQQEKSSSSKAATTSNFAQKSPGKEKSTAAQKQKQQQFSSPKEETNSGSNSPTQAQAPVIVEKNKNRGDQAVMDVAAAKQHVEVVQEENQVDDNEADGSMPVIKTVVDGARCPVVTIEQMRKVEQICVSETGPNDEMMIENAGHGTSVMALKAIGGHRRIQPGNHNAAPVVVVLAGNTKAGSYGLAAARHLANRACHVYVMLAFRKDAKLSEGVAMQRKCAEFAGAHIVESIEDLPQQQKTPVDLIIDGLMGSEYSVSLLRGDYVTRTLLWESMDWANNNKAPVLSLDFPSGINATDGLPFHVMHHIQPKWTLCFGAPKQGCTSRSITGELFLADIGIPSVSWRRIGISRCKIPWGAEFVLALEYEG